MIDPNSTTSTTVTQDPTGRIAAEKHDYNIKTIDSFLDTVFHSEFNPREEILTWMQSSNIPTYPMNDDALLSKLKRVPIPKVLYFGTSTTHPDPNDGKLYNRKTLFERFHVLVLDDIGTKVPLDRIPEEFKPSYIIESSQGNFQYGYVLKEPLEEIVHAEALIQLVYEAGYSDNGGKMATKLVRLPEGINGKKGDKGKFHVKLTELNDRQWTPDEILQVLDLGVSWDSVLNDAQAVIKSRASRNLGTTPWSPIKVNNASLSGIVDPLLEWMEGEEWIKQETNDWVSIKCPWGDQHTSGDGTAGYSPLGRGDEGYSSSRAFKCFHEHCASRSTAEFLQYAAALGAPEVSVAEFAHHLTSTYAFDPIANGVWKVKGVKNPLFIPLQGFRNLYPSKVKVVTAEGKVEKIAETSMYLNSKARVDVLGECYDPTDEAKIVTIKDGGRYVNKYTKPSWGEGEYDQKHIDNFIEFIDYLIPEEKQRGYFLDWVAAKAQDMAFRGSAIIMIAKAQGTGRTTLSTLMMTLFGTENVEKVPFEKLSNSGEFNEWQTIPLVFTDETLASGNGDNLFKVYERIKERIDTTPEYIRVNPKYGRQRFQMTYSSYLMFSNHENALMLSGGDRRFYVISNVLTPAPPKFFIDLHTWFEEVGKDGKQVWARHVWRWLQAREVDMERLLAPAEMTSTKADMINATRQPSDIALDKLLSLWTCKFIAVRHVKDALASFYHRMHMEDAKLASKIIDHGVRDRTVSLISGKRFKVEGASVLLRQITTKVEMGDTKEYADTIKGMHSIRKELRQLPDEEDLKEIHNAISEELEAHGL